ncbi:hypothetical protein Taro_007829 [Colocasia esculenta]|uniref:Plant heme peroxidase family profile domain-containing protein n=1 Tax=Colocasia esculenta TaxID=4460 RepID=A0A843TSA0_COLES|nr:hypothetical protein [Colocasia esculenta]
MQANYERPQPPARLHAHCYVNPSAQAHKPIISSIPQRSNPRTLGHHHPPVSCPASGGDSNLAPLDIQTPIRFDNRYFQNLLTQRGLLHSDQELFNGGSQDALVRSYSNNNASFNRDFAAAMVRMGNIDQPLDGY